MRSSVFYFLFYFHKENEKKHNEKLQKENDEGAD